MKYVLIYFFLLLSFTSPAQIPDSVHLPTLPLLASRITYTGNLNVDTSTPKDALFQKAENWYAKKYETADNTLTIDNARTGRLSGTGIIHNNKHEERSEPGDIFFTIDIVVDKGTFTYKIYSIYRLDNNNNNRIFYSDIYNEALYPTAKPKWDKSYRIFTLNSMNQKISDLISDLDDYIRK